MEKSRKNRLILIMPKFYGYKDIIVKQIENKGYYVYTFYEEPSTLLYIIMRNVQRIFKNDLFFKCFNRLLFFKIKTQVKKADKCLIIRGNILNEKFIHKLKKEILENRECIYYSWDACCNLYNKGKLLEICDRTYTFDSYDAKKGRYNLLPLFFSEEYNNIENINSKKMYDLIIICGFNKYRYEKIQAIKMKNPDIKIYSVFYLNRLLFEYGRITDKSFRTVNFNDMCFKKMQIGKVIKAHANANTILDITNAKQKGLSMRTIESIGLRMKLITNNACISDYDFYNDNNIRIIQEDLKIDKKWLANEYMPNEDIRKNYSIENWITTLLG